MTDRSARHEARYPVAHVIFHGNQGELRQPNGKGQHDQLGALGIALNTLVAWNAQPSTTPSPNSRATGHEITDEDLKRLSHCSTSTS